MKDENIERLKQIYEILESLTIPVSAARQVIPCTNTIRIIIEEESAAKNEEPKEQTEERA